MSFIDDSNVVALVLAAGYAFGSYNAFHCRCPLHIRQAPTNSSINAYIFYTYTIYSGCAEPLVLFESSFPSSRNIVRKKKWIEFNRLPVLRRASLLLYSYFCRFTSMTVWHSTNNWFFVAKNMQIDSPMQFVSIQFDGYIEMDRNEYRLANTHHIVSCTLALASTGIDWPTSVHLNWNRLMNYSAVIPFH